MGLGSKALFGGTAMACQDVTDFNVRSLARPMRVNTLFAEDASHPILSETCDTYYDLAVLLPPAAHRDPENRRRLRRRAHTAGDQHRAIFAVQAGRALPAVNFHCCVIDGVFTVDGDGQIVFVLRQAEEALDAGEPPAEPVALLPAPPPEPVYSEAGGGPERDARFRPTGTDEPDPEHPQDPAVVGYNAALAWARREENCRPDNGVPERRYRQPLPRVITGARGRG